MVPCGLAFSSQFMKSLSIQLICLLFITNTFAQITSTFNTDADGWTCSDNNLASPLTINYFGSGGNPGGYISAGIGLSSQPFFFTSPAKFGGNIAYFCYGQELTFDMQLNYAPTTHGASGLGDVQIRTPAGQILVANLPTFPAQAPAWSTHTIRLDETFGWRIGGTTGPLATKVQMLQFLSGVFAFRFSIDYTNATLNTFSGAIDNVVLNQRALLPSPIISSFVPTSGDPGTSVTITGSNFDPAIANNVVYFGGVSALITNASATSLTVTVPNGAVFGPVAVINKSTGLTKLSAQSFTPTFNEGGRIIPASYAPKFDFSITGGYGGHTIADMDGDGWNDLVVAREDNTGIWIYRNLGLGGILSASSFAAPINFPTLLSGSNGAGIQVADFDNDGKLDMATSGWTGGPGAFATFRNVSTPGTLAFEPVEQWLAASDEGPPHAAADIDGDGLIDLVSGEGSSPGATWISQNISTPGNIEFSYRLTFFGTNSNQGATLADLNNDGKPEFIHKIQNTLNQQNIYVNTSTPGVISFGATVTIPVAIDGGMNVMDINLDGKNDLIWKRGFSNDDIHIRLNSNSGGALAVADFATEIILDTDLTTYGTSSIGDMNGDGKPDILAADNGDFGVFENIFTGGVFDVNAFIPAYRVPGNGGSTYPTIIHAADLNGDGKPELIAGITNTSPNRVSIYENKNVHAPVIAVNTVSPLSAPIGTTVTITGDYFSTTPNNNKVLFGAVEATVLTATKTQLTVSVPPGAAYAPVSVTRDGLTAQYRLPFKTTFSPGVTFNNTHFAPPVNYTLTGADYDIRVGDLNKDGKPDVMAEAGNQAYAFRNVYTSGPIQTTTLIPNDTLSPTNFRNPRLQDLDGDGYPDVVDFDSHVRRNITTGTDINFAFNVAFPVSGNLAFDDFNHDGRIDIAVAPSTNQLLIVENRVAANAFITIPIPSFSTPISFTRAGTGGVPVAADFDGDGFADVVITNGSTDNISIFRNLGLPRITTSQFTPGIDVPTGDNPGRMYTADFNNDNKLDILLNHGTGANPALLILFENVSTVGTIAFNRVDLINPVVVTDFGIADLDGDGRPEIITTSEAGNRFSIIKNIHTTGALSVASFAAPFDTSVTAPRGIITGDINLDGKQELIITRAAGLLVVYENLIPTASIAITVQPVSPTTVCEGSTASFTIAASGTTNLAYQWQKFNSGTSLFEAISDNATFSGTTTATLSINNTTAAEAGQYRCVVSGDFTLDVTTNTGILSVINLPAAPTISNVNQCGPGSVSLTASGGVDGQYRWYTVPTGGTPIAGEVNGTYTTPSLTATTSYYVSVNSGCESFRSSVVVTVSTPPAQPIITSSVTPLGNTITICASSTLNLSAPVGFAGYTWSNGETTQTISIITSGTYSVVVTDGNGCVSVASAELIVTLIPLPCNNQPPVIATTTLTTLIGSSVSINLLTLISDPDNNLVASSLAIVQAPASGAPASITSGVLTINYSGLSFAGTDLITIEVCDLLGECSQEQLEIDVIGEIEIYNAVSPNSDGKNDFFDLRYIDLLPNTQQNKVTIYNRWGILVFEVDNYNEAKAFRGLSSDGKELPSGTYFYKIEFKSGRSFETGYLSLKR